MALRPLDYTTGRTLKTVVRDYSTGSERVWNTSGTPAFEAYNAANIAAYGIATPEGSAGSYSWAVPALPASPLGYQYHATTYDCAGASLATGDLATPAYADDFAWDGSAVTPNRAVPSALPAAAGGLPTVGTGAGQVQPDGNGRVTAGTVSDKTGYSLAPDPADVIEIV